MLDFFSEVCYNGKCEVLSPHVRRIQGGVKRLKEEWRDTPWVDLGGNIELSWSSLENNSKLNFSEIQPGDLIFIKVTKPEEIIVAVDTATKAHYLAPEGAEAVTMTARVCWIYEYPLVRVIQCVCIEMKRMKWYTAELSLRYATPYEPELKLIAMSTPPPAEVPAGNMNEALRKCFEGLNSDLHRPPQS